MMAFECVSSDGDAMQHHIFEEALRLSSGDYVELLDTVVKPWLERVSAGSNIQLNAKRPERVRSGCQIFFTTSPA